MADPPIDLGKLLPKEVAIKFYDDAVSGPAKEVGKISTDALKTVRLILAPLQIVAAFQDRFERMMERISSRVPEENRGEVPPELSGPVLEKIRYVVEDSELSKMFEEILTKGIDKDQSRKVHPSFVHIISQLSRDEAWMLYLLRDRDFEIVDTMEYERSSSQFINRVVEKSTLPTSELHAPSQIDLYYSHLESLSLVTWPVHKQDPILTAGVQTGIRRFSTLRLTEFGRLFVEASIPTEGFEVVGSNK